MFSKIREFFKLEAAGGLLLCASAIIAILTVNSPLHHMYEDFLHTHISIHIGHFAIDMGLHHWINDALMAVFFFLVGLEIKREIQEGELSNLSQVALPGIAAVGGMVVPALIFVAFNMGDAEAIKGWAIPSATDIAFALGILSLCGNRVPLSLKVFLTALAIFDDLGAIVIIALFYSGDLSVTALVGAALTTCVLVGMNMRRVLNIFPYMAIGLVLWACVLKSGVHATLAGVVLGLCIPGKGAGEHSPLKHLEHVLHPWVAFGILPIFGFANAGVDLRGASLESLTHPVSLGVCLGLFLGKQFGIFAFSWAAIKSGFVEMPRKADWLSLYGVCALGGIGFTMSLFVGSLAYGPSEYMEFTKIGILLGSFLSGAIGYYLVVLGVRDANVVEYFEDVANKIRILVGEGATNGIAATRLSETLAAKGYEVEVGKNSDQLVQLATDKEFDLIFLDLDVPLQDVLGSLKDLREAVGESDSFVPVFAAADEEQDVVEGVDRFFDKDEIERDELLKEIEQIALSQ